MTWAYRHAVTSANVANSVIQTRYERRIVTAGRKAAVLTIKGNEPTWIETRFGLMLSGNKAKRFDQHTLYWSARAERVPEVESWAKLLRQRAIIPIDAYVSSPRPTEDWMTGKRGWLVGLYDLDPAEGGMIILTERSGEKTQPILVSGPDAGFWLKAPAWEALDTLAKLPRIVFSQADIFEAKRLSIDARIKVQLPKAI